MSNNATSMVKLEEILKKEYQKTLDAEIVHQLLTYLKDWHQVVVPTWEHVPQDWLDTNINHPYRCFGYYWYFENERDATMFILRWT